MDMVLGNADRFPCEALGWRGNPHNILYSNSGPLQVSLATAVIFLWRSLCQSFRLSVSLSQTPRHQIYVSTQVRPMWVATG